jgi:hypothetical protein
MEISTLDNGRKTLSVEREYIFSLQMRDIKVRFSMDSSMAKAVTIISQELFIREDGQVT